MNTVLGVRNLKSGALFLFLDETEINFLLILPSVDKKALAPMFFGQVEQLPPSQFTDRQLASLCSEIRNENHRLIEQGSKKYPRPTTSPKRSAPSHCSSCRRPLRRNDSWNKCEDVYCRGRIVRRF